jgi:hypothetical protein
MPLLYADRAAKTFHIRNIFRLWQRQALCIAAVSKKRDKSWAIYGIFWIQSIASFTESAIRFLPAIAKKV